MLLLSTKKFVEEKGMKCKTVISLPNRKSKTKRNFEIRPTSFHTSKGVSRMS